MIGTERVFCLYREEEDVENRAWKGTAMRRQVHHDLKTFTAT